ncbi:competence protein CoiA [Candidatus Enterococcus ikei]|uniref:Competence protein CoiA n=1 Tax=Candidatus Enterococcus ikei TaxID=2815326 RepID=A0ABS3GYW2_9ENTE|nr:competence protein CoiA family protein [Enterococcus sp. DIV0869a]MBO0440442.1 hypothetical protein [Enterococcus sp. DIV0869a]
MFNAYTEEKEIITLRNKSREVIEQLKEKKHFCPACNQPVRIKNGKVKIPHFSHYSHSCCSLFSEGETLEHLTLKEVFAKWCEQECIDYELEKYLPTLNQRPDLLIGNIAVEIQCSPLSIQRLTERTQNYQKHGYLPIWICGKKVFSNQQSLGELAKNLCCYSDTLGFYLWAADWETEELTLCFHMEEDWKKRLYVSKKSWSFYANFLLDILNFPNKDQIYIKRKFKICALIQEYHYDLNRKLFTRDEQVRGLQSILYNNRFHVLYLPFWFYYPGLHIFCCRGSDMVLKVRIWKLVQFFDQNVITHVELVKVLKKEIRYASELFYEFPNIPFSAIQMYCLNQLITYLVACKHLVKIQSGWKVEVGDVDKRISDVSQWLKRIENKCLISATPYKNVIR